MNTYTIAIAGRFQHGKSTLLNCLMEKEYAETGQGLATTRCRSFFRYGTPESFNLVRDERTRRFASLDALRQEKFQPGDRLEIVCGHPLLRGVTLIDTPGYDAEQTDDETARTAIREADAVLLVLSEKTLDIRDRNILDDCRENGKRVIVLFNCKNRSLWSPDAPKNRELCQVLDAQLRDYDDLILPIAGQRVLPCNPLWAWAALGHAENERKKIDRLRKLDDLPPLSDAELLAASRIPVIREALPTIFLQAIIRDPHGEAEHTARRLATLWSDRLETHFEEIFGHLFA